MKKNIMLSFIIYMFGSYSAFSQGFQTPAQYSANVIKSVTKSILQDQGLMFYTISKISVTSDFAKAQLVNVDGECLAIPYNIKANANGEITAEVNTAALAICD